jgi:hypothetical protein
MTSEEEFGLFGIFEPDDCSSVGYEEVCTSVGQSVPNRSSEGKKLRGGDQIEKSLSPSFSFSFQEVERQLVEEEIRSAGLEGCEMHTNPPGYRTAAFTFISFPSLRVLDGASLVDRVYEVLGVDLDDEVCEGLQAEFDRLKCKVPRLYSPEFVNLVKTALKCEECLVVRKSRPDSRVTPLFVRAVNALYRWAQLQGDNEVAIPCRSFAEVLGHRDHVLANSLLQNAVRQGFLKISRPGVQRVGGKPTRFHFIGEVIGREIQAAN